MTLIAIPNVSEGRDQPRIDSLVSAVRSAGSRPLDVHSDAAHNRSVITSTGGDDRLIEGMCALASAAGYVDMQDHRGAHPALGGLDVCPFVPHDDSMEHAVEVAREAAVAIAESTGNPVFLYGFAASSQETRELSSLRRGGLPKLRRRVRNGLVPDAGPASVDERRGVVCVGARHVLIAFNVWLRCEARIAMSIARKVRSSSGGLAGVQALGLQIDAEQSQVSMNLIDPASFSIDDTFGAVEAEARRLGAEPHATELVGLPPERFMPDPSATAARLLVKPGRSLESALT